MILIHDSFLMNGMNHEDGKIWFDRMIWGIMTMCAVYASDQIKEVSQSVQELNKNMAVVVNALADLKKINEDHESRLRRLEKE